MHVNQHSLGTMFDSHGPANILVVDDVSQNLKLLSDMLIDAGHTVRAARTRPTWYCWTSVCRRWTVLKSAAS
jgi:PleD family two-component response regulator